MRQLKGHRVARGGKRFFFVSWKGWPESASTWEPEENIPSWMVRSYLQQQKAISMGSSVPSPGPMPKLMPKPHRKPTSKSTGKSASKSGSRGRAHREVESQSESESESETEIQ